jgi:WD40 repeat protein
MLGLVLAESASGQAPIQNKKAPDTPKAKEPASSLLEDIRFRHDDKMIIAVVFTPDGKTVATCGWDNLVRLWDVKTGQEVRSLRGHTEAVFTMAMHPDGKMLASGSNDKTIALWDIAGGKEIRRLQGHTAAVGRTAFSGDGKVLASSGDDNSVRLWDVASGNELATCAGHGQAVNGLSFAPDGKAVASCSNNGSIQIWDVPSGKEIRQFGNAAGWVNTLAYSPDGKTIATGGALIRLWEVATGKERWSTQPGTRGADGQGYFWCVVFSPDGKTIASSSPDSSIRFWETATGKERRLVGKHAGGVANVAISPDGKLLASSSHDKTGRLWDLTKIPEASARKEKVKPNDIDSLWSTLTEADAVKAYQAITTLESAPDLAVPYLKKHAKPVEQKTVTATVDQITKFIADLDADDFAARESASEELSKLGENAGPALRKALAGNPSAEASRRIDKLLESFKGPTMMPEDLRLIRAIEVLENVGTGEARAILKRLSEGTPQAQPTQEATQALARLDKRIPAAP